MLGQQIKVYTDYKNPIYKSFSTERVMRWRLFRSPEDISSKLIYIKGSINIVADDLSCLDIIDNLKTNDNSKVEPTLESLSENFDSNNKDTSHPTSFKTIIR